MRRLLVGCSLFLLCLPDRALAWGLAHPLRRPVEVCVTGVLAAPAKIDGRPWDGVGGVIDGETLRPLMEVLASRAPAYSAVLPLVLAIGELVDTPEVAARVQVVSDDENDGLQLDLPPWQDALVGTWGCSPLVLTLNKAARLRVLAWDVDVSEPDAIGAVELTSAELDRARKSHTILHVWVGDRTNYQLLFLDISVREVPGG